MLDKELLEQFKELSYEFGRKELVREANVLSYHGTAINSKALQEAKRNRLIANWDSKINHSYDIAVWNKGTLVGLSVGEIVERPEGLVMVLVEISPSPRKGGIVNPSESKHALEFIEFSIKSFAIMANLKRIFLQFPISTSRTRLYRRFGYTVINEQLLVKEV